MTHQKLSKILKVDQSKEVLTWVNSKVNEAYSNKYKNEVVLFKPDFIEKSNRSIEKQTHKIDKMYDLISNLENVDSKRPKMVKSDWTASGNVGNDLRSHRIDAKHSLLKILEAKINQIDNEIENKEIQAERKYNNLKTSSKMSIKLFEKETDSGCSMESIDFESKENLPENILEQFS